MKEFVSVQEAQAIVLAQMPAQPPERIVSAMAVGRTLLEDIRSRDNIPPFDNSAMDGYAVRAADVQKVPQVLQVGEDIPAGSVPQKSILQGTCARIMTGAPMPEGADAVVPVEQTRVVGQSSVEIFWAPRAGAYVRKAAEDLRAGDTMLKRGHVITPPMVGMLATLGVTHVHVACCPRVAVISTGDELVPVGAPLVPGKIRDSNAPALAAQVASAGGDVVGCFHASDSMESIYHVIQEAMEADILLFSGGVSVGSYDYVRQVLDTMKMEFFFWKVRQRPGKPLAFGRLEGRSIFGLPGNPVSSAICCEQYVRPALARMLGRTAVLRPRQVATLLVPIPKRAGLHYFTRGIASINPSGRLEVRDTGPQASNLYSSMVRANCLFHLPEEMEEAPAGTHVEMEWLPWELSA